MQTGNFIKTGEKKVDLLESVDFLDALPTPKTDSDPDTDGEFGDSLCLGRLASLFARSAWRFFLNGFAVSWHSYM